MLRAALLSVILLVVGLTALSQIGVNIAPLLAGAGVIGIAVGFGGQKLVQDVITGMFVLLENAIQIGDWVTVAGLSGAGRHSRPAAADVAPPPGRLTRCQASEKQ